MLHHLYHESQPWLVDFDPFSSVRKCLLCSLQLFQSPGVFFITSIHTSGISIPLLSIFLEFDPVDTNDQETLQETGAATGCNGDSSSHQSKNQNLLITADLCGINSEFQSGDPIG